MQISISVISNYCVMRFHVLPHHFAHSFIYMCIQQMQSMCLSQVLGWLGTEREKEKPPSPYPLGTCGMWRRSLEKVINTTVKIGTQDLGKYSARTCRHWRPPSALTPCPRRPEGTRPSLGGWALAQPPWLWPTSPLHPQKRRKKNRDTGLWENIICAQ